MNLGAFRKFIGSVFIGVMLFLWHFTCLMYPLYDRFNDNKVFVGQPIQQRIHTPPYGTFDGIPIFEYVPVKGNVKHFSKLKQKIHAGRLPLVFDSLDVPGSITSYF